MGTAWGLVKGFAAVGILLGGAVGVGFTVGAVPGGLLGAGSLGSPSKCTVFSGGGPTDSSSLSAVGGSGGLVSKLSCTATGAGGSGAAGGAGAAAAAEAGAGASSKGLVGASLGL